MVKTETTKINFLEKLIIFLVVLFKYLITIGVPNKILYIFLFGIILLALIDIFKKKVYIKEIKIIGILSALACYFIIFHFDQNFLISFILALVILRKNDKEFIKIFFYSSLICFCLCILINLIGITEFQSMIRKSNEMVTTRYYLGFRHPNEVFLFLLPIVLSGFYLFSNKKVFYIITLIVSIFLYKLTYSRTGLAIIIIFLFLVLIRKVFVNKKIKNIVPWLFLLFTVISVFMAIILGNKWNNPISILLSRRPYYWNYYIENGDLISFIGSNRIQGFFLDNFYMYLLVELGLIGYIIYFVIYYLSLKKLKYNYRYLIIITVFLIYGIFEANVIIGSINFLLAIQIKEIIEDNGDKLKKNF